MEHQKVVDFWFGDLKSNEDVISKSTRSRWFMKSDEFDREIKDRFSKALESAANGELDSWLESGRGRLGFIILLDQFSRNIFRDQANSFDYDPMALKVCLDGIEKKQDEELLFAQRSFFYMPLMHSEDREIQKKSIEIFTKLGIDEGKTGSDHLEYAIKHKAIIDRFGRYPHRNQILERTSTPEEIEFLKGPNSSF